jgi:hypothetical protein
MSGREGSRPDPLAPTELAHLPPRRERTDEHWPPPPAGPRPVRNLKDLETEHTLLRRDFGEQQRALGYVEDKADRANEILDGVPGSKTPGLRTIVHSLSEGMSGLRSRQDLMIVLLLVIAASLGYMAWHVAPK